MYVFQYSGQISIEELFLLFGGKLDPGNRWILLSTVIPWLLLEGHYAPLFNPTKGAPAKPFRMAFASICIQQRMVLLDRETVELITESPLPAILSWAERISIASSF
jgi:IS5 family transposase